MGASQNIHTYTDVHQVLMAAKKAGSANYRLATIGAARHWLQRANTYARLLASERSVYILDDLSWRISKEDPCVIQIGPPTPEGELTTTSGKPLEPDSSVPRDLFHKGLTTPAGDVIPSTPLEEGIADLVDKIKKGGPFS